MSSKQLLSIELPYNMKPTVEQVALLEKYTGKKPELEEKDGTLKWLSREYKLTLEECLALKCEFEVKEGLNYQRFDGNIEHFGPTGHAPVFNQKTYTVVAGTSLLDVDQVCVKYDLCTDQLQRELNSGFMILAICVQPDQRRPDYILGKITGSKHKPEEDYKRPYPISKPAVATSIEKVKEDLLF